MPLCGQAHHRLLYCWNERGRRNVAVVVVVVVAVVILNDGCISFTICCA